MPTRPCMLLSGRRRAEELEVFRPQLQGTWSETARTSARSSPTTANAATAWSPSTDTICGAPKTSESASGPGPRHHTIAPLEVAALPADDRAAVTQDYSCGFGRGRGEWLGRQRQLGAYRRKRRPVEMGHSATVSRMREANRHFVAFDREPNRHHRIHMRVDHANLADSDARGRGYVAFVHSTCILGYREVEGIAPSQGRCGGRGMDPAAPHES
jgi:hypothetical protein